MVYNHIYNLQFKGNDQVGTDYFYKVKFEKSQAVAATPAVIELIPAQDQPFVLNYKAANDNIFSPLRSSYADIKCFIPVDSLVQPSDFFFECDEYTWKLSFYESDGTTESLKWVGFLLPDIIQYEWQEQYYLQLTATDNLAVLKDIKYTRSDYYSLYEDTSVYAGISAKDFVCRLLKKTGSDLDVAIFSSFKIQETLYNFESLKLSDYSGMNWDDFTPKDCYFLLTSLLQSLGLVCYQSNKDATWYIVSINQIAVNNLITDGSFSVDYSGPGIGQPYEYWFISGDVVNSETGGLNGGQCPKIKGDNIAYVSQDIALNATDYTVGFWAKNDGNISPPAFIRVELEDHEIFSGPIANGWNYYQFDYSTGSSSPSTLKFYNNNDDSTGYMSLDNVVFQQKYLNSILYNIDGTDIGYKTIDVYSSIGKNGNVIWSDRNQLVSLNKRLTGVQFKYKKTERNLVDNFGFWKDYDSATDIPTDWDQEGSPFVFLQNPDTGNRPFDPKTLNIFEKQHIASSLILNRYLYTTMMSTTFATDLPARTAIKIECAVNFSTDHNDNDYINIAFAKSSTGNAAGVGGTRYLNYTGDWVAKPASSIFNHDTRIPIFVPEKGQWFNFKCLSKYDSNWNFGTLIIRPQINNNLMYLTSVLFDNFKVSVIVQGMENTVGYAFASTNLPNSFNSSKPFTNVYSLDNLQYHGGYAGSFHSLLIEDFIGYVGGDGTIVCSDKWLRPWEVYNEESPKTRGRTINTCTTNSILSFYQATWQKFTGNVYGKNINFGQAFTIALADGLHFMHEARFDYAANKTNITTHQSQTDKLEINFRTWSTDIHDSGAGQGEPGSTTSKIQNVESLITPIEG